MSPIENEITELWGQITAATYRFLELVAEYDKSESWAAWGIPSCAYWLNIYCGIGQVAAREKVRVARAIEELPQIREAFRDGRVSYSKVRAMTRVATPENEHVLLNVALHGTASHVERTVRFYRRVKQIEEAQKAAKVQENRYFNIRYEDDGTAVVYGRLPAEVGALVSQAIEQAMKIAEGSEDQDSRQHVSAETNDEIEDQVPEDRHPFGARRADGLRLMAEHFLGCESARSGASSDAFQVVVHIDQAELCGGQRNTAAQRGPEDIPKPVICELEDGPALAAETARRLACGGALVGIVDDDDGEPLDVGRKTRAISPALRRALKARDKGCRFPGCTHTRFTQAHHVEHWAHGGETRLPNLITLCHFHHHLVHEGGFGLERTDDGLFVFTKPNGDVLPEYVAVEKCFRGNTLPELNRRRGIRVGVDTVVTRWQGEAMDYSIAIEGLLAADGPGRPERPERPEAREATGFP